ncbi:MAG: family 16 glycoside hydrolase [Chthoniobacteraceae bacterium]
MQYTSFLAAILTLTGLSCLRADDRTVLFADDFENRTELGKNFTVSSEWPDSWKVTNGILVAKQDNPDHGAVLKKEIEFHNIEIEFDFRFSGGTRFNLVIDDKKDKSVHAGHICRASFTPTKLTLGDDKTGKMNLEVQKLRDTKNLPADQQKAYEKLLASCESSVAVDFAAGKWHHVRVRIEGDTMEAFVGDKKVATLKSPGVAQPTKTSFGFTVTGATIDFDNLKVFAVSK